MTILGDAHQSVNPYTSSSIQDIRRIFPEADQIELHRSYRSTFEITAFAQRISPNDKLIPVERHGPQPTMVMYETDSEQVDAIADLIHRAKAAEQALAVVCKTTKHAAKLHRNLADQGIDLILLDQTSTDFVAEKVITSVAIAKGLEFDTIIVPDVDGETYRSDIDRSMLYIACTRAMHHLHLTGVGAPSILLT